MAGPETGGDRTEQPTTKRLEEARRQGQVPRSRDLSTAAVVLIGGLALRLLGGHLAASFTTLMHSGLALPRAEVLDENRLLPALAAQAYQGLQGCAPLLGLTLLAALLSPLALGGWNLSFTALVPDVTRLDPLSGLQRLFSTHGVAELLKAYVKFLIIGLVAVLFLHARAGELLRLGAEPLDSAIAHAVTLAGQALLTLSASLVLIAAIDVPWQLHQHRQQLRMSREEIRQEMRESDGAPEIKGRIRRMQQELSRRRMLQDVPKADVVIVNPTHYAVALRYEEKRMRAPVVVAKGVDEVAANIRSVANGHDVPIFAAPPLARALFRDVDLGAEVPATLYVAVAQVLTYVYQLRMAMRHGASAPTPPVIDPEVEATRH